MVVLLKLKHGPLVTRRRRDAGAGSQARKAKPVDLSGLESASDTDQVSAGEMAQGVTAVLSPASAAAVALAIWRIGADVGWAGRFAIAEGVFSHWQVWFGLAAVLQAAAYSINRRNSGKNDPTAAS